MGKLFLQVQIFPSGTSDFQLPPVLVICLFRYICQVIALICHSLNHSELFQLRLISIPNIQHSIKFLGMITWCEPAPWFNGDSWVGCAIAAFASYFTKELPQQVNLILIIHCGLTHQVDIIFSFPTTQERIWSKHLPDAFACED